MGQVLHGCARTTEATRREIQNSQESLRALAKRYGINPKTVAKWRKRETAADAAMGPKNPRSTVLTEGEEAAAVAFRKHTLLPLDDCLYALQETIPRLTRSSLHRCFQRHGISRLPAPEAGGGKKPGKKFKPYPIGFFHIDITEVRTGEGKLHLFVAIDRASKLAFAILYDRATKANAADFLGRLAEAVPYRIHTVLTDNGIQFADLPKNRRGPSAAVVGHAFGRSCELRGIEHRLTKPGHPWTNGQVERMNRTIKEATVYRYHYGSSGQLQAHLGAFLCAYNFAKRLKALKGLTPCQFVAKSWGDDPSVFARDPAHFNPGLYTYGVPEQVQCRCQLAAPWFRGIIKHKSEA